MRNLEVGGCVRDRILGKDSNDIDFVVVLEPNEKTHCEVTGDDPFDFMVANLIEMQFKIFDVRPQFLTVRAQFPKGHKNSGMTGDFVLARKESDYSDGRRPDTVEVGTLEDDLRRRDFTFNAMAQDENGEIIDLFNGRTDLFLGLIKTVNEPWKSFGDDHLRMMRALRFSVTLGFRIGDMETLFIEKNIGLLATVSRDRVRKELAKMFDADPARTVQVLNDFKVWPVIFDMGLNLIPTEKAKIK
jgi:tRNA nucleotidyltransferase/poly(A) polymerase